MTVENRLLDKADWYFENALTNYLHSYSLQKEELTQKIIGRFIVGLRIISVFSLLGSSSMMPKK